jgi:hypothetical protein
VAARLDAPVLGVQDTYTGPDTWQVSTSWRYQRSHRHFVGDVEQTNRALEDSEVINTINQPELGIRYNLNKLWSFSLGIPYLIAERSSPIRDANRVVVDRSITQARGVGDITLIARRLLWEPSTHPDSNLSFGLGIKLPTGADNVVDSTERIVNGQRVLSFTTVDQSIQPGDGGFGIIGDLQAFQRIAHSGLALYFSGTYLSNPRDRNGVHTFRGDPNEAIMSVADQYLARLGGTYSAPSWKGFGIGLGGRLEGVPVRDIIGSSDGFRRPGFAVSLEPSLSASWGPHTVSLAVPIAVYRDRPRSVADLLSGGAGDAAFADYIILLGYWRKF